MEIRRIDLQRGSRTEYRHSAGSNTMGGVKEDFSLNSSDNSNNVPQGIENEEIYSGVIEALKHEGTIIRYFQRPTDEMVRTAVENCPEAIEFVQNPTEEL